LKDSVDQFDRMWETDSMRMSRAHSIRARVVAGRRLLQQLLHQLAAPAGGVLGCGQTHLDKRLR